MGLARVYICLCYLVIASLTGYAMFDLFYTDASAECLDELAERGSALNSPAFNKALRGDLSNGYISNYECSRLISKAKQLDIEMKKQQAEATLNKIADTAK